MNRHLFGTCLIFVVLLFSYSNVFGAKTKIKKRKRTHPTLPAAKRNKNESTVPNNNVDQRKSKQQALVQLMLSIPRTYMTPHQQSTSRASVPVSTNFTENFQSMAKALFDPNATSWTFYISNGSLVTIPIQRFSNAATHSGPHHKNATERNT